MKKAGLVGILALALLFSACATAATPSDSLPLRQEGIAPEISKGVAPEAPAAAEYAGASSGVEAAEVERIVIKNADLSIAVTDPAQAMKTISTMADEMKGFVVSSNLYKTTDEKYGELPAANITIRIPAERLDEALERIKALVADPSLDILSENVSGEDVTKDYTDLKSRLTSLEQARQRLEEIMASATDTEDVLNVYNRIVDLQQQIEVTKGQIQYYEESARLSAISVRIVSKESIAPLSIGGWQPAGVARNAIQALINALKFLANFAIWLVLFILPVLIVILIPIWILWVLIRRWRARRKAARLAATPPTPPDAPAKE
ncbi:MAG: DUF4349 domain-containing protein [Chloroflexi bacterium]|nr:DUF4349 domain-containing protein [Chloroflexota bacterium]